MLYVYVPLCVAGISSSDKVLASKELFLYHTEVNQKSSKWLGWIGVQGSGL